jgi:peptide/nickel transport system permease protein
MSAGVARASARRIARLRLNAPLLLGGSIVALLIVGALTAPLLAPFGPDEPVIIRAGASLAPAPYPPGTPGLPLGSDELRRDMLSRLLYGCQYTLLFCGISAVLRVLLGAVLGALAGWYEGLRPPVAALVSACSAIPPLIFALMPLALINARGTPDASAIGFVIVFGLTGWAETSVRVRAAVEELAEAQFVESAFAIGRQRLAVLVRHIAPNLRGLLTVELATAMGATLLLAAELAFLGVFVGGAAVDVAGGRVIAVDAITAEWGNMLALGLRGRSQGGWLFFEPLLAFLVAILGFNLLAEGLRRR